MVTVPAALPSSVLPRELRSDSQSKRNMKAHNHALRPTPTSRGALGRSTGTTKKKNMRKDDTWCERELSSGPTETSSSPTEPLFVSSVLVLPRSVSMINLSSMIFTFVIAHSYLIGFRFDFLQLERRSRILEYRKRENIGETQSQPIFHRLVTENADECARHIARSFDRSLHILHER